MEPSFPMTFLRLALLSAVAATSLTITPCVAVTTVIGGGAFSMEFVEISRGTVPDDTGFGAVPYNYRISVHEVSREMIEAYNDLSGGPTITITSFSTVGGDRPTRPATGMTWNAAARFVNWLNTSQGHAPAYQFVGTGITDEIALWAPGDPGYNPNNPFRNSEAFYFLPSENEWYRAAYFDPVAGVYWDYATGSNTPPTSVTGGTSAGSAVYNLPFLTGPSDITTAGGLSPFGTMAQNGNVREWTESAFTPPNDGAVEQRTVRDGAWDEDAGRLASTGRILADPRGANATQGFRVASIPEPSGPLLALLAVMTAVFRSRRR